MGDSKLKKIFCNEDIVKRLEIWSLMFAIMYIAAQFIIYFIAAILCYKYSFQTLTPLMAAVYSTAGAIQIVPYIIAAVVMLLMKKPSKLKLVGFLSFWAVWKLFGSQILFVIDKALCDLLEPVQYLFSHIFSANFAAYCVKNTYHTSVCLRIFSL